MIRTVPSAFGCRHDPIPSAALDLWREPPESGLGANRPRKAAGRQEDVGQSPQPFVPLWPETYRGWVASRDDAAAVGAARRLKLLGEPPLRVICVAGARPNFMKVSPILRALTEAAHVPVLVHTGQHYDPLMSGTFFDDLDLPAPHFSLEVGSGSHAQQTARVMERFEPVLEEVRPDWVLVVGDVNSTMACALVSAKLRPALGCRLAHVEAGLRSHDWRMPEEVNRAVTDRVADLLLTPSRDAHQNLAREGLEARAAFVGNVMIDTMLQQLPKARAADTPRRIGLASGAYVVCTIHRPTNVDDPAALQVILTALARIGREAPVVLPIHPRTMKNAVAFGFDRMLSSLQVVEPLGYRDMLSLTAQARVVLTDSGGLQEETTVLGVPCVTLREQTERPATITEGTNRLAPWPLTVEGIVGAWRDAMAAGRCGVGERVPEGWDGLAAPRIVAMLAAAATWEGGMRRT